jgi:hypothetical protein
MILMALLEAYFIVVVNLQKLLGYPERRMSVSPEVKSRNHRFLIEHLDEGNLGAKEVSYDGVGPVSGSGQTTRQALPPEQGKKRPLAVRFIGYVFFLIVVFAASVALGGGIAVAMEHLGLL